MKKSFILYAAILIIGFAIGAIASSYIPSQQAPGSRIITITQSTGGSISTIISTFTYSTTVTERQSAAKREVYILEAATLKPLVNVIKQIMSARGYTVIDEAKGSTQLAREINDLGKRVDLFIPIDSEVVEKILMPSKTATWYRVIASSSIVFVYSNYSESKVKKGLDMLGSGNLEGFFEGILSGDYRIGLGNPDNVPQGYRTLMVLKLAGLILKNNESYYLDKFKSLLRSGKAIYARDAAALNSLIQTGAIDVSFTYLHEAILYGLKYARLPKELDLSDPSLRSLYSRVNYTTSTGQTIVGAPIEIVVTIPKTAANREAALAIISYLLTNSGKEIIRNAGLNPVDRPEIRGSVEDLLG